MQYVCSNRARFVNLDLIRMKLSPQPATTWLFTVLENQLPPETLDHLASYRWPGNVRELRTAIERAVVLARGEKIGPRDLPPAICAVTETAHEQGTVPPDQLAKSGLTLDEVERLMIINALKATESNRSEAARRLGISRRTLHRKLHDYKLEDL